MKNTSMIAVVVATLCACTTSGSAFVLAPVSAGSLSTKVTSSSSSSSSVGMARTQGAMSMSDTGSAEDRRAFLSNALQGAAALGLGLGIGLARSSPAFAGDGEELGDLSAGTPTPMDASPASGEDARIARKLAAQAKITGKASSGKMTVSESMSNEAEKQSRIAAERKDKERRRAVMCEELGRGC